MLIRQAGSSENRKGRNTENLPETWPALLQLHSLDTTYLGGYHWHHVSKLLWSLLAHTAWIFGGHQEKSSVTQPFPQTDESFQNSQPAAVEHGGWQHKCVKGALTVAGTALRCYSIFIVVVLEIFPFPGFNLFSYLNVSAWLSSKWCLFCVCVFFVFCFVLNYNNSQWWSI